MEESFLSYSYFFNRSIFCFFYSFEFNSWVPNIFQHITLLCFLALKVFKQLNLSTEMHLSLSDDKGDVDKVRRPWDLLSAGHKIGTPKPLFRELVCFMLWK